MNCIYIFYTDAPNIFTEKEFTKEHYENSVSLLKSLNHSICSGIAASRHDRTYFSPVVWQLLRDYGSLTANNAKEIGLIDILSPVNPLDDLIRMNQLSEEDNDNRKKWLHGVDVDTFHADEIVTLNTYMKLLTSRKAKEERKVQLFHWPHLASTKSSAADAFLQILGYVGPYYNLSKVSSILFFSRYPMLFMMEVHDIHPLGLGLLHTFVSMSMRV